MKVRALLLAGALAVAGTLASAGRADAQVTFGLGFGNPYGYGSVYPATYYATPTYSYGINPLQYGGGWALNSYASPYWTAGYSPYWYGGTYGYADPFYGSAYRSYYYTNPGYGLGRFAYRWGRWRW
jgi:hypothetical protein